MHETHEFGRELTNWDFKYLDKAKFCSKWSKDPSTQVGAVISTLDNHPVSEGYNGFPQKVKDTHERLHNRDIKYKIIIHGELNALIFAQRSVQGCRLYTYPFMPCATCASIFIQAGIAEIVAPFSDNERWIESFKLTEEICAEAGVRLIIVPKHVWDPEKDD